MQPKIYTVDDHDIDVNAIDNDALYVLKKLQEAGYEAYLVGGSVRDLLLKRTPKDYDISTSARPEEIKHLFQRRCILIGRRFRLAHVRFGHKIIEVSTFRSGEGDGELIVQDNQWGTAEEDVLRRDFTINGLFYDPIHHTVIDYVNGWSDIHANTLRTIGDPEIRFKQDPVRMIRLLKFRARFGFQITDEAKRALLNCKAEILKSSQARMLEEMLRMLESGAAAPFFNLLQETGILSLLYPTLSAFIKKDPEQKVQLYLRAADKINLGLERQKLDRIVLFSCLIYPMLERSIQEKYLKHQEIPHLGEILMATNTVLKEFTQTAFTLFPRRITVSSHALLATQYRLTPLNPKAHLSPKVFRYKEFPFALSFLQIRALVDKGLIEQYGYWKSLYRQHHHPSEHKGHRRASVRAGER